MCKRLIRLLEQPIFVKRRFTAQLKAGQHDPTVKPLTRVKTYKPPADVETLVYQFAEQHGVEEYDKPLSDQSKFEVICTCVAQLKRDVPNNKLAGLKTVNHILEFFRTPVDARLEMDKLADSNCDLPNVHIEREYPRFADVQEKWFHGKDAYPDRDTLVTSLWYGRKYKSHVKQNV